MKKISKFLSLVLRHKPDLIGIELNEQGWVEVDILLARAAAYGTTITRSELATIVGENDKQRFTLSADGKMIRAAQGHSVPVALGLEPVEPPTVLFHGTATRNLAAIRKEGLKPGTRQQVHLSADVETALKVGQRHGKPHVLQIAAKAMRENGLAFYQADNGVWLTDRVPPEYLTGYTD